MTRYLSPADLTMLAGTELTLCRCVKLTLRDSTVKGFTDHDADLVIGGVTYRSAVGLVVGALRWTNRLESESTELRGIFSSSTGGLTEELARQGYYNEATVDIFLANWTTSASIVPLKRGVLASMIPQGTGWVGEVRSLSWLLTKRIITRQITKDCNAELGDARCGFSAAFYSGTVTSVTNLSTLVASAFVGPADPTDLVGGRFTFTSGSYTWFANRIKAYDAGSKTFTFVRPFPAADLDDFKAYEGCPKTLEACRDRFANLNNFRGFPFVPDKDKVYKSAYPSNANGGYAVGVGEDD